MLRRLAILPMIVLLAVVSSARTAEQTSAKSPEAEIRKAIAAVEESFNRGDAKGLAACWAADGEFIGPQGHRITGRPDIAAAFSEFLTAQKTSKLRLGVASWRLVADNVATVDLLAEMTPPPEGVEAEPVSTAVLVRRDGQWLIASMRETPSGEPSHHVRLKCLEWLVGDWAAESTGASGISVRSTCDWTANGSYLIRKFTVEVQKGSVRSGTEVIGWDPRLHRIRSWTFASDGGLGESTWTRDGEHWMVVYTGTQADGGDVSAVHVVTPAEGDTLIVRSKDRVVNGEKQPDLPEVKLKRRAARDEAKPKPSEPANPPRQVLP